MLLGSGGNGQGFGLSTLRLGQLEDDAVLGFAAAWAVVVDDLYDHVEQRLPLATLRVADPGLDVRAVRWVAGEEDLLQPSDGRVITERDLGRVRVDPPEYPSGLRSAEASSEDVVEGIEVSVPGAVTKQLRELAYEAGEVDERGSVDDKHGEGIALVGHDASMGATHNIRICRDQLIFQGSVR